MPTRIPSARSKRTLFDYFQPGAEETPAPIQSKKKRRKSNTPSSTKIDQKSDQQTPFQPGNSNPPTPSESQSPLSVSESPNSVTPAQNPNNYPALSLSVPPGTDLKKITSSFANAFIEKMKDPNYALPNQFKLIENKRNGKKLFIPYSALSTILAKASGTTKRIEKTCILAEFFSTIIYCDAKNGTKQLSAAILLATNTLGPPQESLVLGLGDSLLQNAISKSTGASKQRIRDLMKKHGDLGIVAGRLRKKQEGLSFGSKPLPISILNLLSNFRKIALTEGKSSMETKTKLIHNLFFRTTKKTSTEISFIVKHLSRSMRIGLGSETVACALAHSVLITPPYLPVTEYASHWKKLTKNESVFQVYINQAESIVKQALAERPDWEFLVSELYKCPLDKLSSVVCLQEGTPVKPMLAKPTEGIQEVLRRMDDRLYTCEYKYDGERVQVHYLSDGSVKLFSRNLDSFDAKYPDIQAFFSSRSWMVRDDNGEKSQSSTVSGDDQISTIALENTPSATPSASSFDSIPPSPSTSTSTASSSTSPSILDQPNSSTLKTTQVKVPKTISSFILDCEAVGFDRDTSTIQSFNAVQTRSRKNVVLNEITNHVCCFAFDILSLNGKSLLHKPFLYRRTLLHSILAPQNGFLQFATAIDTNSDAEIQEFFEKSIVDKTEGLMVKTLVENSEYTPSKRTYCWLKIKKDYIDGLLDSFDLVCIGAYTGKGKRTGWYGGFLMAVFDPDEDSYRSICKVGTGFTEQDLQDFIPFFQDKIIDSPPRNFHFPPEIKCDVWFEPTTIFEISAADMTLSPAHHACRGALHQSKGVGLRFPRFVKLREDKDVMSSSSPETILEFYHRQENRTHIDEEFSD